MSSFETLVHAELREQDWPAIHAQPLAFWAPALARLGGEGWERLPGGEDSAVFARGSEVVKLVPPFYAADAAREAAALTRVRLPFPTPELWDLESVEGWTALRMSRLDGARAEDAWPTLSRPDQLRVMAQLGEALRALWATPLTPADEDPQALLTRFRERAQRHGDDAMAWMERALPATLPSPAWIHLDLNTGNAMLRKRNGRWELCGVLDFVASRAFYPPLDLITPGLFFGRGDPALLRALLQEAGLAQLEPEELVGWHLLHPFSQIERDLGMCGLTHPEELLRVWGALRPRRPAPGPA